MDYLREIDDRIAKCEKILEKNPGSQIFAALAEAHRKRGDVDSAFKVCQRGLKIHPDYGSAHVVMAKINIDKGLYDWAETEVDKALTLGGNVHTTDLLRAEIDIQKGDLDKAKTRLNRLRREDPTNTQITSLLEAISEEEQSSPKISQAKFPQMRANPSVTPNDRPKKPISDSLQLPRMTIDEILKEAMKIKAVFGAFHLSADGSTINSEWTGTADESEFSVMSTEMYRTVGLALERVSMGTCQSVLVESQGLNMYYLLAGEDHFAFFADSSAKTSRMRATLNRLLRALATASSVEGV